LTLLTANEITKEFIVNEGIIPKLLGTQQRLQAVRDVSFDLDSGETLALVGESGAGKSTVGRTVAGIQKPTSGQVLFRGNDIYELEKKDLEEFRRSVQMVFQNPHSSLDPRYPVGKTIAEPLKIHTDMGKRERHARVETLLEQVNLDSSFTDRYPHELSGGQLQRVAIATALSVNPDLIILDEPVSALDVSVQAQILNLLKELQDELGLSYLFISHDLSVVKYLTDRVAVMYLGEIVEVGHTVEIFNNPKHPYTEGLLGSIPDIDPTAEEREQQLTGEIPSPLSPPNGCAFHPRCKYATEECSNINPALESVHDVRQVACHHWEKVGDQSVSKPNGTMESERPGET
jgi:peptide/nickel transport system ATP-binding protein/oligopeptide transport system ATP-binding protein